MNLHLIVLQTHWILFFSIGEEVWSLMNKLIVLNGYAYNHLQLPYNVLSGIFHDKKWSISLLMLLYIGCEISLAGSHHTCAGSLADTGASEFGGAASGKTNVPVVWMMVQLQYIHCSQFCKCDKFLCKCNGFYFQSDEFNCKTDKFNCKCQFQLYCKQDEVNCKVDKFSFKTVLPWYKLVIYSVYVANQLYQWYTNDAGRF